MRVKKGDRVTCKHTVEAYYSGYSGNPVWKFEPGMIAVVHCVSLKVSRRKYLDPGEPQYDMKYEFVVADYDDQGTERRIGLDFCNVRKE